MLTKEQIESNANKFLDLLDSITTEGYDKAGLENWLMNKSDFFKAPASTRYHSSYEGGLCQHSLNVYYNLCKLVDEFASHEEPNPAYVEIKNGDGNVMPSEVPNFLRVRNYDDNTIKIVSLLHDISKSNFYEKYNRNVKDDEGKWTQVSDYRVKESDNRFIYGNHEQNSEFMVRSFYPLTTEESVAILNHHAGMSDDCAKSNISLIFNKYSLATLLHLADMLACYIDEKI